MQDPILKFKKYFSQTRETVDICEIRLQYFSSDAVTELWDYETNSNGDWKRAFKCGEINSREHVNKILFGMEKDNLGYIYSFAKVFACSEEHHPNDHLVVTLSGYEPEEFGRVYMLDLAQYANCKVQNHTSIIDDYDLLMQKYKEIT